MPRGCQAARRIPGRLTPGPVAPPPRSLAPSQKKGRPREAALRSFVCYLGRQAPEMADLAFAHHPALRGAAGSAPITTGSVVTGSGAGSGAETAATIGAGAASAGSTAGAGAAGGVTVSATGSASGACAAA